jgi:photosystem II stability/assembly factor-like uncharacterized protein
MLIRNAFFATAIACVLGLCACQENEPVTPECLQVSFRSLGLEYAIVNELELRENKLYAATDDGLYVKDLTATADWMSLGLQGKNVKTLVFLENNTLLAATSMPEQEEYLLYKSTNGGQDWQLTATNYGNGSPEPINDFAFDEQKNILYASGWNVVARSEDMGSSWTPIYGAWQSMATGLSVVAINPATGDLWAGGQNAIEGFTLAKQDAQDGQWQEWQTLLPSPSTAKSIAFSATNPQRILVGGEDGIIMTTDGGQHWSTIKSDHTARFYFGLEFDQKIPERVYAASWVKNFHDPQPLTISISEDAGASWAEYIYPSTTLFGGVWSMVQKSENTQTHLYLGLYKGGVYEAVIQNKTTIQ